MDRLNDYLIKENDYSLGHHVFEGKFNDIKKHNYINKPIKSWKSK